MKLNQFLLAATVALSAVAVQAQTIQVMPSPTNVKVGDAFSVDLQAMGFPDPIVGGGYNIAFDASKLRLDDIVIPASWEFATSKGTTDPVAGTVSDVFFNTFSAPVSGSFLTSTLKFTAIGAGSSNITLTDSPSFPFANTDVETVAVSYVSGSVNVAAVPEPGPLALLLATGIASAGLLARRRS